MLYCGEFRDDTQNFTSENNASILTKLTFPEQHNKLHTAKDALQYSLYNPHNNPMSWVLCPPFYRGQNSSHKSQGCTLAGWVPRSPHFLRILHSMALVFTAQILTEVNTGTK